MRLDVFLKKTGVIKRRTIANDMAKADKIFKCNVPLKASYDLKANDEIEIKFSNRVVKIKVVSTEERKPIYEIVSELMLGFSD